MNCEPNVKIKKATWKNIEKYISIFEEAKHDAYISHGELLCGRATHDFKWAENIVSQMKCEFMFCSFFGTMFEILVSEEIVGFAIVELKTNLAILSDIMIKNNWQDKGIGAKALLKIEEFLKNKRVKMLLLESGKNNKNAHKFFEKNGFKKLSVSYAKHLS
jgi:ribosomal protein S18 acetylase RimI-like enzyme